ncbi:hypothetical protein SCUCBS95973_008848 [Sporothrix curviconia]|uniref:Transthyretin/hydroxyisourate hydrolase domain-containing protein n=1 Tax=Sporothrix curviconia TaxID=1260050 RepID=A0ABP0CPY3_9PEZI
MAKDRITCHILDTAQGCPAAGVRVRLELVTPPAPAAAAAAAAAASATNGSLSSPLEAPPHSHHHTHGPTQVFESQTNEDGRVAVWLPYSASNASGDVPVYTLDDVLGKAEAEAAAASLGGGPTTWTLRFDTDGYYDGKAFFPEVAVTFRVAAGQHYHVPLLLNPFSYTTYRGS